MSTQRCEEKSTVAREEEGVERGAPAPWLFLCPPHPHPPAGPALCKWGQPGVLFILPEVLTPVGPSFVLFSGAFLFLIFQPPPFWTPFSYSNYLTVFIEKVNGCVFLGIQLSYLFLQLICLFHISIPFLFKQIDRHLKGDIYTFFFFTSTKHIQEVRSKCAKLNETFRNQLFL